MAVTGHDQFRTYYPAASVRAAKAKLKELYPDGEGYRSAAINTCCIREDGTKDSFGTPWKKYPGKNWVYMYD